MTSSCCTAPPTGRSSPRSTPRSIRATSRRWCSTRSSHRRGPDPLNRATFAAVPRILNQLCGRTPAPASPQPHRRSHKPPQPPGQREAAGALDRRPRSRPHDRHLLRSAAGSPARRRSGTDPARRIPRGGPLGGPRRSGRAGAAAGASQARHGQRSGKPQRELQRAPLLRDELRRGALPVEPGRHPEQAPVRSEGPDRRARRTRDRSVHAQRRPGHQRYPGVRVLAVHHAAPRVQSTAFPGVPALILSGADDLRTPTANAREVAAEIPGSKLLVVPNVGHSVLGDDPTSCSSDALQALFVGKPIKPCPAATPPPLLRATPLPPARLPDVAPAAGNGRGKPGRTLTAVLETLADSGRQLALQVLAQLSSSNTASASSVTVGGLRSGWAALRDRKAPAPRLLLRPGRDRLRRNHLNEDRPARGRGRGRAWDPAGRSPIARRTRGPDRGA